jgi:hypothetical protein
MYTVYRSMFVPPICLQTMTLLYEGTFENMVDVQSPFLEL